MEGAPPVSDRYAKRTRACVALGLSLRLYHYARNPSMWHDEAALVLNVLGKNLRDLLGPLFFGEAAPPLFLWIERGAVELFGDGVYVLRLVPFLASCAALLLMVSVARRTLRPQVVPWAILLFACSDHLLWHACEAKPYSVDVLAATLLLAIYVCTRSWTVGKQIGIHCVMAPFLIFLSYPGCFLYGGLLLALLPAVWSSKRLMLWAGFGLLTAVITASFAILLAGPIHAQRCPAMDACWVDAFPNWSQPWTVPTWTALSTFEMFRYCFEPIGQVFLIPAILGVVGFWRRNERRFVCLLVTPVVLALGAGYVKAYPYGGSRVMVYVIPALALLIGEGLSVLAVMAVQVRDWSRLHSGRLPRIIQSLPARRVLLACVLTLLLIPVARAAQRIVFPWSRANCSAAANYVLANRRAGDEVVSNHWEYAYYFRGLGDGFSMQAHPLDPTQTRLWVVTTAATYKDRLEVLDAVRPHSWRIADQREFTRSTVFLVTRPEDR